MISSYTSDTIRKVRYSYDEWGATTKNESSDIEARVEDYNQLVLDQNGKEVMGNSIIFVSGSEDIKYTDRLKIKKRIGTAIENPDKEYEIKKLSKQHGFELQNWEIII